MGISVMLMGQSGSGKSCSIRTMPKDMIGVFNVAGKPLPFRGKIPAAVTTHDVDAIIASLKRNNYNCYIIDDSQYLMSFKLIDKVNETGYGKYTEIAKDFKRLVDAANETSNDTTVFFLHHVETTDDGLLKAKTTGKMIDNWLTLEGLFSIVIMATVSGDRKYKFITQSDGTNTCKSPMGMFPEEMENDLLKVDTAIREYYEMKPIEARKKQTERKTNLATETDTVPGGGQK